MNILPPVQGYNPREDINQFFGVNYDRYMEAFGLEGHNGVDLGGDEEKKGYGTELIAAHNGVVESISYDVPHKTKGNGVYILDDSGKFSTVYWHLASFEVQVGDKVKQGEVIGTMGNSGWVFPKPSNSCPHCGTHLHFAILDRETGEWLDPVSRLHRDGMRYAFHLSRDLFIGRRGNDVAILQTFLKIEGFAKDYEPIGFFGPKTMRDVIALQRKYDINPPFGYVGRITRSFIHNRYAV